MISIIKRTKLLIIIHKYDHLIFTEKKDGYHIIWLSLNCDLLNWRIKMDTLPLNSDITSIEVLIYVPTIKTEEGYIFHSRNERLTPKCLFETLKVYFKRYRINILVLGSFSIYAHQYIYYFKEKSTITTVGDYHSETFHPIETILNVLKYETIVSEDALGDLLYFYVKTFKHRLSVPIIYQSFLHKNKHRIISLFRYADAYAYHPNVIILCLKQNNIHFMLRYIFNVKDTGSRARFLRIRYLIRGLRFGEEHAVYNYINYYRFIELFENSKDLKKTFLELARNNTYKELYSPYDVLEARTNMNIKDEDYENAIFKELGIKFLYDYKIMLDYKRDLIYLAKYLEFLKNKTISLRFKFRYSLRVNLEIIKYLRHHEFIPLL